MDAVNNPAPAAGSEGGGEPMRAFTAPRGSAATRRRRGLYHDVVEAIGRQIIDGDLEVGAIVYVEQICAQLEISRSVVREGIRTLSSMGLLESRPQRGTRVLPRDHWDLLNPHIVQWRAEGPDYLDQAHELLELRVGIEQAAARFAALRMSQTARDAVVQAGEEMMRSLENRDAYRYFQADADLHRLMLEGADNPMIAQFADAITASLQLRGRSTSRSYSDAHSLDEQSAERHIRLAHALAAGDPDTAQQIASEILTATIAEIEHLLEHRRRGGG